MMISLFVIIMLYFFADCPYNSNDNNNITLRTVGFIEYVL